MQIYGEKNQIFPEIKVINLQKKDPIFPAITDANLLTYSEINVVNLRETTQIFP